jgi:hypothetical protein
MMGHSAFAALLLVANIAFAINPVPPPLYYPVTAHEISARVTPKSTRYPEGYIDRYGADPTGTASSCTAMNSAIQVEGVVGGVVKLTPGGNYTCASTITLPQGYVAFEGYGAAWTYTGSATAFTLPSSGFSTGLQMHGLHIIANTAATAVLELLSPYHGSFTDLWIQTNSATVIGIDLNVNTFGTVNPDGNLNAAYNNFSNILFFGSVGKAIRLIGATGGTAVVTLNTFSNIHVSGPAWIYGIEFNQWTDNNNFSGMTRIGTLSQNGTSTIGVVWNSGTPGSNVGVYANNFDQLAVDCFGTPTGDTRIGLQMNWTKQNSVHFFYQQPACAGGRASIAANAQNHFLNTIGDTGAGLQPFYYQTGTYTATLATGCTTAPTFTVHYSLVGNMVTLWAANAGAALFSPCAVNSRSRATDASLPPALRPATTKLVGLVVSYNSATRSDALACVHVSTAGELSWNPATTGAARAASCAGRAYNNSGTTSLDEFSVTYDLN